MRVIKEKKERSLGVKLLLKADRCNSPKCVMIRRPYRPGMHGQARRKQPSDYGRQLTEKQKLQFFYGLNNRKMRTLFQEHTREEIISLLQQRLDQVVFLLGFVKSPRIARQIVSHGHILVNNRKVTIGSFQVKKGDIIAVRPESRDLKIFKDAKEYLKEYQVPEWLKTDKEQMKGECVAKVQELSTPFQHDLNLVGQFYAR